MKDKIVLIMIILVAIGFIWRPLYEVINTPDPKGYGYKLTNQRITMLKHSAKLYNEYLDNDLSGTPQEMDQRLEKAMVERFIKYTLMLLSFVAIVYFLNKRFKFLALP